MTRLAYGVFLSLLLGSALGFGMLKDLKYQDKDLDKDVEVPEIEPKPHQPYKSWPVD